MSKELIRRKESTRYPGLFVEKYSNRVFYDALWNSDPALIESRGIVKDADGNVVIRPFTKIFNRHENGTDIKRDEKVLAVQKINGFMGAATYVPSRDQVVVSTTGSLDSEYVDLAIKTLMFTPYVNDYIRCEYNKAGHPMTYLFEIVDPSDPHIIQEEPGAYLIGARYVDDARPYFSTYFHECYLDVAAEKMKVKRPKHWGWPDYPRFSDVVQEAKVCKHEGFVVYGQESKTVLKIKSPYYLMSKAAARIKDISTLDRKRVDEEFYPLIDALQCVASEFNSLSEQERLNAVRRILSA